MVTCQTNVKMIKVYNYIFLLCALCQGITSNSVTQEFLDAVDRVHSSWLLAMQTTEAAHLSKYLPYKYSSQLEISDADSYDIIQALFDDSKAVSHNTVSNPPEFYPKCADDVTQILYNLDSQWALKMLDSNGKLMSGVLLGAVTWPGNYKECLDVYSPLDKKDHGDFSGKYCMVSISLNISKSFPDLPLSTGVCIPDSCEGRGIKNAIKHIFKMSAHVPLVRALTSRMSVKSVTCKTGPAPMDSSTIFYLFILSIFVALVFCGSSITAFEYFSAPKERLPSSSTATINNTPPGTYGAAEADAVKRTEVSINEDFPPSESNKLFINKSRKTNKLKNFLLCFCAFTNGSKILKIEQSSGKQMLSIHGVRFLSLTWVIIGHTYIIAAGDISNKLQTLKDINGFMFQMLMNSPFSVDSFFLLSGLLLGYLFLKEADRRNGKINWLYFYLHRLWRLTPVYLLLVGFYMLVFKYTGSGPFWDDNYGDSCRHTWWQYVLYISNFIPIHQMCVGWSWYLANDMQFYLVSPLFLYPLWRWPKVGMAIIAALMGICWTVTGILTSKHNIIPMLAGVTETTDLQEYQDRMWDSFDIIYDKPYCRIAPYLVGILAGYALYKAGDKRNFLTWWQQGLGWLLATFCSASVIFGLYHIDITPAVSIMYNSFSRTSFVMGLAWLIYACETGHAGFLHSFLSWKVWIPLSRLTYCAYLLHPMLVHGYYMGLQAVLYFTHTTMVILFLGILIISYVLAFIVSFTFESPMMNLEKLLLKRGG